MPPKKKRKVTVTTDSSVRKKKRTASPQPSSSTTQDTETERKQAGVQGTSADGTSGSSSSSTVPNVSSTVPNVSSTVPNVSSGTTSQITSGTTSASRPSAVLSSKQNRRAADEHAEYLRGLGFKPDVILCDGILTLSNEDVGQSIADSIRLDILVDTSMCSMLMEDEDLHSIAKTTFKDCDKSNRQIYAVNKFADDFELLFSRLPKNICNRFDVEQENKRKEVHFVKNNTGMSGGESHASLNAGTIDGQTAVVYNYITLPPWMYTLKKEEMKTAITREATSSKGGTSNIDNDELYVRINGPKEEEILSKVEENKENIRTRTDGVKNVDCNIGSVIISLTLEEGHVVTEEWITDLLKLIFDDILGSDIAGETFTVQVERQLKYISTLPLDSLLHKNCITYAEHKSQVDDLKLELENIMLKKKKMTGKPETADTDNEIPSISILGPEKKDESLLSEIIPEFIKIVDPAKVLPYLALKQSDMQKIQDIQDKIGQGEAAKTLLEMTVASHNDWVKLLPQALRNPTVGMASLADMIEEKSKELEDTGTATLDPVMHKNCILRTEHQNIVDSLKMKIETLKEEKEKLETERGPHLPAQRFQKPLRNQLEEQLLTCRICHNILQKPCTLSCQHSFCRRCIQGHIDARKEESISCPLCRKNTDVPNPGTPMETWSDQIPLSHVIRNLMDTLYEKKDSPEKDGGENPEEFPEFNSDCRNEGNEDRNDILYNIIKDEFIKNVDAQLILSSLPLSSLDREIVAKVLNSESRTEGARFLLDTIVSYPDWLDDLLKALRDNDMTALADFITEKNRDSMSEIQSFTERSFKVSAEMMQGNNVTLTNINGVKNSVKATAETIYGDRVTGANINGVKNNSIVNVEEIYGPCVIEQTGASNNCVVNLETLSGNCIMNSQGSNNTVVVKVETMSGNYNLNLEGPNCSIVVNIENHGTKLGPSAVSTEKDHSVLKQLARNVMEGTHIRMQACTSEMIKTSPVVNITDRIKNEQPWITLIGNPGAGKTTAAFMAMNEMAKVGRDVFHVQTPNELSAITATYSRPVIMLDSIFGELQFDRYEWLRWKPTLKECTNGTVIIVGRFHVLMSDYAKQQLTDAITCDTNVVELSFSTDQELSEKYAVLKVNAELKEVCLSEEEMSDICKLKSQYGFPFASRLFVSFRKKYTSISPEEIITDPVGFLKKRVASLSENILQLNLLKLLLKHDGSILKKDLQNLDYGLETFKDLEGLYLTEENGNIRFDHPIIFDVVSFTVSKLDPVFVIEQCSINFQHQRLRLSDEDITHHRHLTEGKVLIAEIPVSFNAKIAKRHAAELQDSLLQILSHKWLTKTVFIREVLAQLEIAEKGFPKYSDPQSEETFLNLIASNKSEHFLLCIEETGVKITQTEMNSILFGVFKYAASGALTYISQTQDSFDVNVHYGKKRQTALMLAAESGDKQFVQQVLSFSPELNASDWEGKRMIHYLSENGLESALRQVIDNGINIDVRDWEGHSPLYYACRRGEVDVMNLLLDQGARIEEFGISLLHTASVSRRPQAIQCLLDHGADINNRDQKHNIPLHVAAARGSDQCVDVLLEAGACTNAQNDEGNSPLHKAASNGSRNCVESLLKAGADVNIQNIRGDTPLHEAAGAESKNCVTLLLKAGSSVNLKNADRITPLLIAAETGSVDCLSALLEAGAEVDLQRKDGMTPLHLVTEKKFRRCVDILLEAKSDVNIQSLDGKTPLYSAVRNRSKELTVALLKAGAFVNVTDNLGKTPLHIAVDRVRHETIPVIEICEELLSYGADTNLRDKMGNTPLHLLSRVEERDIEYQEWQAPSSRDSIVDSYKNLAKLLLDNNADVNLLNSEGYKALHGWLERLL